MVKQFIRAFMGIGGKFLFVIGGMFFTVSLFVGFGSSIMLISLGAMLLGFIISSFGNPTLAKPKDQSKKL